MEKCSAQLSFSMETQNFSIQLLNPVRKIGEVAVGLQSRKELHHVLRGFCLTSTALTADDDALRPAKQLASFSWKCLEQGKISRSATD